jgi:hypothetical protein
MLDDLIISNNITVSHSYLSYDLLGDLLHRAISARAKTSAEFFINARDHLTRLVGIYANSYCGGL